ncbi:hypothetical protein FRB96_000219 [Tulasnella sp. 330]|nr:hypothetical protein FRB96_000219 [Tulasnella sp. 330]
MDIKPTPPISPTNPKDQLAKLRAVSSPASPLSPSDVASPKTPNQSHRKKNSKRSTRTNSPTVNVVSPSSPGSKTDIPIPPPLEAKSPLSQVSQVQAPSLTLVSEGLTPDTTEGEATAPEENPPILEPAAELKLPGSPMPSSRPYTPQYRDWAAEGDEDDNGSLPSLDDWGLPGVRAASEAGGDSMSQSRSVNAITESSLAAPPVADDPNYNERGRRSGSAPPVATSPKVPSFVGVIPPTPTGPKASGPGRSIKGAATAPADRFPSTLPEANLVGTHTSGSAPTNRSGLAFARENSPRPLNLVRRDSIGSMSGLGPRPQSPGFQGGASRSGSPRPTSGGVALGSRPSSPAPGSPSFNVVELSRRPESPSYTGSRPGSPALSFTGSRPSSPAPPRTGGLSGGVSLGPSRSGSPNPSRANSPRPGQTTFQERSATLETPEDWRKLPTPRLNTLQLQESPIPPTLTIPQNEQVAPKPLAGGSLASRMSDPPLQIPPFQGGRGGGINGRGNFRGRFGRGGFLGPSHPLAQVQGPASPASPSTPRGRGSSFASLRGGARGDKDNAAGSPTTPSSPSGKSNRGHARTPSGSRPVISSLAISKLGATLNSPSKTKPSPTVES